MANTIAANAVLYVVYITLRYNGAWIYNAQYGKTYPCILHTMCCIYMVKPRVAFCLLLVVAAVERLYLTKLFSSYQRLSHPIT